MGNVSQGLGLGQQIPGTSVNLTSATTHYITAPHPPRFANSPLIVSPSFLTSPWIAALHFRCSDRHFSNSLDFISVCVSVGKMWNNLHVGGTRWPEQNRLLIRWSQVRIPHGLPKNTNIYQRVTRDRNPFLFLKISCLCNICVTAQKNSLFLGQFHSVL